MKCMNWLKIGWCNSVAPIIGLELGATLLFFISSICQIHCFQDVIIFFVDGRWTVQLIINGQENGTCLELNYKSHTAIITQ
jgi:hypothetical protein